MLIKRFNYVTAPTCAGAVALLLVCGQELGRNQGKAGLGAKNQRLNGLVFGGEGANRQRFSRCRLQRLCVLSYLYPYPVDGIQIIFRHLGLSGTTPNKQEHYHQAGSNNEGMRHPGAYL